MSYEERRTALSKQYVEDAQGFYYKEACLKMNHGKPLSDDNHQALKVEIQAFRQKTRRF